MVAAKGHHRLDGNAPRDHPLREGQCPIITAAIHKHDLAGFPLGGLIDHFGADARDRLHPSSFPRPLEIADSDINPEETLTDKSVAEKDQSNQLIIEINNSVEKKDNTKIS